MIAHCFSENVNSSQRIGNHFYGKCLELNFSTKVNAVNYN